MSELESAPEGADVTSAPAESTQISEAVESPAETEEKQDRTLEENLKAVWDKNNPPRNKFGQFQSKDGEEQQVSEDDQPQTEQSKPETTSRAIDAPQSWSSDMRSEWASLPPKAQEYILQRERQAHETISRQGQVVKAFEPIGEVINHFAETFKRNDLHPAEGFARLLEVENRLAHDAVGTVVDIARAYNVDPQELIAQLAQAYGVQQSQDASAASPEINRLKQALMQTQDQVRQLSSGFSAQQQQSEQAMRAALQSEIDDFAKDKPHFNRVALEMANQIKADQTMGLAEAYDLAVYKDKELRAQLGQEQAKKAEAKRIEDAKKKAAEARRSGSVNVKSTPASGTNPKTMDDTLREVAFKNYGSF